MSLWTAALGGQLNWIDVDGVRTRVLRIGERGERPLVLLHGRGGHLETFVHNIRSWSANREVIAFDLLGHGMTDAAGSEYSVAELLRHARSAIAQLCEGDIDVVGQSLGGWLAARIALEETFVRRLILVEPAGFQSDDERFSDPKVRVAAERGGQSFDNPTTDSVTLRFRQLLLNESAVDPELIELRTRLYSQPSAGGVHKAVRRADNSDWLLSADQFEGFAAPLLILRGEEGHTPEPILQNVADQAANGALVTIADAKQWPHFENPTAANAAVTDFLERNAA